MFLASDVIKRHFGAHTESQESSSLPVAKHFLRLSRQNTPWNLSYKTALDADCKTV